MPDNADCEPDPAHERGEDEDRHHADGEHEVLTDDPPRPTTETDRVGEVGEVFSHDDHIRRLERYVRSCDADRDPDIGDSQRRRVIDPVPDHRDATRTIGAPQNLRLFVRGESRMDFLDTHALADRPSRCVRIAGEHHHTFYTTCPKRGNGASGTVPGMVLNRKSACMSTIDRDVDEGGRRMLLSEYLGDRLVESCHAGLNEGGFAHTNPLALHMSLHPFAGERLKRRRLCNGEATSLGRPKDRGGEMVLGPVLCRRGQGEESIG